ncbi:MAG TPA: D-arabinono-1,4-lactone oxidase [Actinocatenispora sp.]
MTDPRWANWAGNQRAIADAVARPTTATEIADLVTAVRTGGGTLKPVGSGHSFTGAAATTGTRLEPAGYAGPFTVDRDNRHVTVPAGMPLYLLNQVLTAAHLACPNLGDIDRQTVAGAISTGTHGTGARLGGLATFVAGLTLVTGTGEVLHCSPTEHRDEFDAARLGVGAVGVLTEVELACVDAFTLAADERPLPLDTVLSTVDEMAADNDHVEFYWFPYTERCLVKRNNRTETPAPLPRWRGYLDDELLSNTVFSVACRISRRIPSLVPRINWLSARALGARTYADRSDRVFCTPRRVRFVEMEYAVPRAALPDAFAGLRRAVDTCGIPIAFPVEVRLAAADDIWLSTAHGRDTAYLAVHQYVGMPYEPYFRAVEAVMRDLDGRPHWGKMHWRDADSLRATYPRFDDFLAVRDRLDPDRVFANAYTRRVFGD